MIEYAGSMYYTVEEIAEIFGVKKNTIAQWVRRGHIEAALTIPAGRSRRSLFQVEAIRKFAQERYGS